MPTLRNNDWSVAGLLATVAGPLYATYITYTHTDINVYARPINCKTATVAMYSQIIYKWPIKSVKRPLCKIMCDIHKRQV